MPEPTESPGPCPFGKQSLDPRQVKNDPVKLPTHPSPTSGPKRPAVHEARVPINLFLAYTPLYRWTIAACLILGSCLPLKIAGGVGAVIFATTLVPLITRRIPMLRGKTSEFHQQPDTCSDSDIDSKNDTTTPLIPEPTRFPSHHDYVPPGVVPGNSTARIQGDFVVFLIGARANTPSAILDSRFGEIGNAMTAMRKELQDQPELGCLGAEDFISMYGDGSQILAVQYWRSVEHLHAYARGKGHVHVRAVPKFIKIAKDSPDFGAWHETFAVKSGDYETFYLNMPPFGLGNARETQLEQVPAKWRTMKQRMGRATDPNSLDPPEW